jgi:hypothetical protein
VAVTTPLQAEPTVAGEPLVALYRRTMYPATATPFDMCAALQLTAMLVPEALAVGELPVGIVAAALPPAPLPCADHAASAAAGTWKASASVAQAIGPHLDTVTPSARARCR